MNKTPTRCFALVLAGFCCLGVLVSQTSTARAQSSESDWLVDLQQASPRFSSAERLVQKDKSPEEAVVLSGGALRAYACHYGPRHPNTAAALDLFRRARLQLLEDIVDQAVFLGLFDDAKAGLKTRLKVLDALIKLHPDDADLERERRAWALREARLPIEQIKALSVSIKRATHPAEIAWAIDLVGKQQLAPKPLGGQKAQHRQLALGEPRIVEGQAEAPVILQVLKRRQRMLRVCYERELKRNPSLGGRIVLEVIADFRGRVTHTRALTNSTSSSDMVRCVESGVRRLRFPAPDSDEVVFEIDLSFSSPDIALSVAVDAGLEADTFKKALGDASLAFFSSALEAVKAAVARKQPAAGLSLLLYLKEAMGGLDARDPRVDRLNLQWLLTRDALLKASSAQAEKRAVELERAGLYKSAASLVHFSAGVERGLSGGRRGEARARRRARRAEALASKRGSEPQVLLDKGGALLRGGDACGAVAHFLEAQQDPDELEAELTKRLESARKLLQERAREELSSHQASAEVQGSNPFLITRKFNAMAGSLGEPGALTLGPTCLLLELDNNLLYSMIPELDTRGGAEDISGLSWDDLGRVSKFSTLAQVGELSAERLSKLEAGWLGEKVVDLTTCALAIRAPQKVEAEIARHTQAGAAAPTKLLLELARGYYRQRDLIRAQRAVEAASERAGPGDDKVAILRLRGSIALQRGDPKGARRWVVEALDALGEGPGHALRRSALLNLEANIATAQGELEQAHSRLDEVLGIWQRALGRDHPVLAVVWNNLAVVHWQRGQMNEAAKALEEATVLWVTSFGARHPRVGLLKSNLAIAERARGNLDKAHALNREAIDILSAQGDPSRRLARVLENQASATWQKGAHDETLQLLEQVVALQEKQLRDVLGASSLSEAEKLAFVTSLTETSDTVISFHLGQAPSNAGELALATILQRKGRVLDAHVASRGASALAAEALELTPAKRLPSVDLSALRFDGALVERAREKIPSGAVLVEFAAWAPYQVEAQEREDAWAGLRYAVYVLGGDGALSFADLGEASAIDSAVARWREAVMACPSERPPCPESAAATREAGRALYDMIGAPMLALTQGADHLLIAPDHELNLLPFEALVDPDGRFLADKTLITYLTSGRDLLRPDAPEPGEGLVVVANPDFDGALAADASANQGRSRGEQEASLYPRAWAALPGTDAEARALLAHFPEARVVSGVEATETTLSTIERPRVLHLATHGFFLSDEAIGLKGSRGFVQKPQAISLTAPLQTRVADPMARSGVVLAGVNNALDGQPDDGIATARELTSLDLAGTRLVVLSACETGLGEVRRGQGVHGLRRALVLAGAETQVMSLWQVADEPTAAMMDAFYRRLKEGHGRSQALRLARRDMRENADWQHPYFWAPFILSGQWRTLSGDEPPAAASLPPASAPRAGGCACRVSQGQATPGGLELWVILAWIALVAWRRRPAGGQLRP